MTRQVQIQLWVFAIVTTVVMTYAAFDLFGAAKLFDPPYKVEAQFEDGSSLYERADVDLLGVKVGTVVDLRPGPDGGTTATLAIDHDTVVPADVVATVGSKSAIGEPYVQLKPLSTGGRVLKDGDTIKRESTRSPTPVVTLLSNLDRLVGSVDTGALRTVLSEATAATRGLSEVGQPLVRDSDVVTASALRSMDDLTALIRQSRRVLETQVDLAPETTEFAENLAPVLSRLAELSPDLVDLLGNGSRAAIEVSELLNKNESGLHALLGNGVVLTNLASSRLPQIRKTLVLLPWTLESVPGVFRYCDEIDAATSKPIKRTCHYDEDGNPIYSAYLGVQLPEVPGGHPYNPCTKGYEGTPQHLPDGTSLNGGPREGDNPQPNLDARCSAGPDDSLSPSVRGSQNAQGGRPLSPMDGFSVFDPKSTTASSSDGTTFRFSNSQPPVEGGLAWLLSSPWGGQ